MNRLLSNGVVRVAILATAAMSVAWLIVPGEFLGGSLVIIRLCLAAYVAVQFAPLAWQAVRARPMQGEDYLGLGLCLVCTALTLSSAWTLCGLVFHFPTSVALSGVTNGFVAASCLGYALMVVAPGVAPPLPRFRSWLPVALLILLAGIIIGVLLATMPIWRPGIPTPPALP